MTETTPEDFIKTLEEQFEQSKELQIKSKDFKHKYISSCKDGRFKVKITCQNEWLDKEISVITNNDQIGITPFGCGHIARLNAYDEQGESLIIYGYFNEDNLRDADENVYINGICDSLKEGTTNNLFGGYNHNIREPEEVKPPRNLSFEDVKEILIDPWRVLVVDSLSGEFVICTSGQEIYDILEEVLIDRDTSEQLESIVDENIILYSSLNDEELKKYLPTPHFYELWNEDAYGHQPNEAYEKAKSMGLEGGFRN